MVQRQVASHSYPDSPAAVPTTPKTPPAGKAHGGFVVGLALVGPVLMGLVFAFIGLLMQGAQGATGLVWAVAPLMFTVWSLALAASLALAEAEEDGSRAA